MLVAVTERLCWRVKELPAATGLGLPYWRKQIRLRRIKFHKPAGSTAVVIFHSDLIEFLKGKEEGN